jgi:hypothetical protein
MASAIVWTESSNEYALVTNLPLQVRVPGHHQMRYSAVSEDGSVREVLTVGSGQDELVIDFRHEYAAKILDDAQRAGADGIDLILVPDVTDQNRSFTVQLIQASKIQRDGKIGEAAQTYKTQWRVRRMDGGALR